MYTQIDRCRICGNAQLKSVLHLGTQFLTGIFPKRIDSNITAGPLELVKCHSSSGADHCGLLQLRHSYDLKEMYGENYGYRSSLNRNMVDHLHAKVDALRKIIPLQKDDLVVDVGSNDGTTLSFYPEGAAHLLGIDPTAAKFKPYYRKDVNLVVDFFSAAAVQSKFPNQKARIITSIAMFYDIEDPLSFVKQIESILADDGIWHFEQSYVHAMLNAVAYDTVCHEHLEYYSLRQIKWLTDRANLKIIDVQINNVNGGSFAITVAKKTSHHTPGPSVQRLLDQEVALRLDSLQPYEIFADKVVQHKKALLKLVHDLHNKGAKIFGYGASTKGNVILQYCNFTPDLIPAIAEVNQDKFGSFTPGTNIPIISEEQAHALKPDYLLVLPWHFRDNLIKREQTFLQSGGKMIFPLPSIQIVSQ